MQEKKQRKSKEAPTSLRGMRDIIGDEHYDYQGFFEKAAEIAVYYGFKPIETPILEKEEVFTSGVGIGTDIIDKEMYSLKIKGGERLAMRPEGTAGTMRAYLENGMRSWPQPVMLYSYGSFFRHENPQKGRWREFRQFNIEMLGTSKSIADAMIIKIIATILEEAGLKNIQVRINSIGDKECRPAYIKELTAYYRKHLNSVCANCQQRIKTNPLRLLDCKDSKCTEIQGGAPDPISSLCNECRTHFKEVIEYLEETHVSYEIDNRLVRGLDYYTKTVFEIFNESEPLTDKDANEPDTTEKDIADKKKKGDSETTHPLALAAGGRYDRLAESMGSRKPVPSVGGGIGVDRVLLSPDRFILRPRIVKKPKVYFIQLGFEAKLKCIAVIEILRKARVPIMHSVSKDKLSGQLAVAERLSIPYTVILGQKEAMEGTVIVRNMNTRSQDTVALADLAMYIKKIS